VLVVESVTKTYRNTKAVADISMRIGDGEALGIVGHNGAGKSTLIKVVAGLVTPDAGTVVLDDVVLPPGSGVAAAKKAGVRLASQEVVLCPDLLVLENVALAHPELFAAGRTWRRDIARRFDEQLAAVFPGRRISAHRRTGALSLTDLQIVQLTIATMPTSVPIRTLILDEPTSALTSDLATALFSYVKDLRHQSGLGVVIISHKMRDIVDNSERVLVMRDGRQTAELRTKEASADQIIAAMGGSIGADPPTAQLATEPARHADAGLNGQSQAPILSRTAGGGTGEELSFTVLPGEIVGLAGLEGQGQTELLAEIWRMSRHSGWLWRGQRRWTMARRFSAAYVSGDRQQFGLLPLWEVRRNISVASLSSLRSFGLLLAGRERSLTADWVKRVQIREGGERSVLELSGGTQQKVLLARGMAARSDVLLLDDPFRGVDVITKEAAYRWIRDEADSGKAVVWYSSETAEFHKCDRAYVMRDGTVRAVLSGPEISDDSLIRYSFDSYAAARDHPGSHVTSADGRSADDV
jgi:ribose transport system ATP-binding protein